MKTLPKYTVVLFECQGAFHNPSHYSFNTLEECKAFEQGLGVGSNGGNYYEWEMRIIGPKGNLRVPPWDNRDVEDITKISDGALKEAYETWLNAYEKIEK